MASFFTIAPQFTGYAATKPKTTRQSIQFGQAHRSAQSKNPEDAATPTATAPAHQPAGFFKKAGWGLATLLAVLLVGKFLGKGIFKSIGTSLGSFLSSGVGQWALNLAKSEAASAALISGALGIGQALLPKSAFALLKQHATHQNLHQLLNAETLSKLFNYGKELLSQAPNNIEGWLGHLDKNSTGISEHIGSITGLKPESIKEFLKALNNH